jgi:hypothetical protein
MPFPSWAKPLDPEPDFPEWAKPLQAEEAYEQEDPGFIDRVTEDFAQRGQNIGDMIGRQTDGSIAKGILDAPTIGALALGQGAGFAADVIGQGVKSAYKTLVPEPAQEAIAGGLGRAAETRPGQLALAGLEKGTEAYQIFKEAYPDAALALEGTANLAVVGAGAKGVGAGVAARAKMAPERLAKEYTAAVEKGIEKSIRPSVAGKRTFGQRQKYMADAERAIGTIVKKKETLRLTNEAGDIVEGLPQNLKQFSQSIQQTKEQIYKQYDDMAQAAGQAGARVTLKPIAKELDLVAKSKPLQDNAPEVVNYARMRAESLRKRGSYTTKDAQEALTILNNSLDSFYKNPSYETASRAYIDSLVANNLRKGLDNVIEKTTAPGYQELKRDYGALKSIERDVNRRAMVDARKNVKGLIDFSDVFSGGHVVHGLVTMNPAVVGQGAAMKAISSFIKHMNDPNKQVKNLFQRAEKLITEMEALP